MRPPFFYKRWHSIFILSLVSIASLSLSSYAQNSSFNNDNSYVVVGAFSLENNADRFGRLLSGQGLDVKDRLNTQRNLYYVYAYESQDREAAIEKLYQIRENYPDLYDAWVYTGDFKSVYSPPIARAEVKEEIVEEVTEAIADTKDAIQEEVKEPEITPTPTKKPEIEKEAGHYYVYVNTVNGRNAREVQGKVEIIDPVRAKRLSVEPAHQLLDIEDPNNGSKTIKISPSIFGFKPTSLVVDLENPVQDTTSTYVTQVGDSTIVSFELERFRKGDFAVLFNVYFYKDAAIMKEESVYELNQLRDMMLENNKMKIKIHGHTNGNSYGKVLHLDENDKDFFSLKGEEHKEASGSAKKLSEYRAVTIKRWLEDQGIAESRLETKGWGGKRPITDKHDSQAHKNVRVEIEVLADE